MARVVFVPFSQDGETCFNAPGLPGGYLRSLLHHAPIHIFRPPFPGDGVAVAGERGTKWGCCLVCSDERKYPPGKPGALQGTKTTQERQHQEGRFLAAQGATSSP
jgi:hypothetical protein